MWMDLLLLSLAVLPLWMNGPALTRNSASLLSYTWLKAAILPEVALQSAPVGQARRSRES